MEFQKGHAHYLTEALEQPLLLPKDMAVDLFLSLKRDLALVSLHASSTTIRWGRSLSSCSIKCWSIISAQVVQEVFTAEEWVKDA